MKAFILDGGRRVAIDVDDLHPLGVGATARICPVVTAGYADRLAKVYAGSAKANAAKLHAMLANPPSSVFITANGRTYPQYAWPTHLLRADNGRVLGYLMPRVDEQQSLTLDFFYHRHLLGPQGLRERTLSHQLELARNLSGVLDDLHRQGHCFIDFKPQNIKVFREVHLVALLDCDSYRVASRKKRIFPATNFSSEYIAPEALDHPGGPSALAEDQDRFALAVVLFQLLNNGIHPFQAIQTGGPESPSTDDKVRAGVYAYGISPHPAARPLTQSVHHLFDDGSRALFDQAFTTRQRPSAAQWKSHFHALLIGRQLERCPRHPQDPAHIHFAGKTCATCHFQDVMEASRRPAAASHASGDERSPTYVWPTVHGFLVAEAALLVMLWTGGAMERQGLGAGLGVGALLASAVGGFMLFVRGSLRRDMVPTGPDGEMRLPMTLVIHIGLWIVAVFLALIIVTSIAGTQRG